jgi:hypothetical protein
VAEEFVKGYMQARLEAAARRFEPRKELELSIKLLEEAMPPG